MKKLNNLEEKIKYYVSLPYTTIVERMDDQGVYYIARILELDGLIMTGNTPSEAIEDLESVKHDWIEAHLELGNKMPLPLESRKYSGQISLRIPSSLHKVLVNRAEVDGVSLNQYMTAALAQSVGWSIDSAKPITDKDLALIKK